MTLGEKLQQLRKKEKLSQEDLAQKLLVSRQTISLWEKDQTIPTIDNLRRLKDLFNISIDEFLNQQDFSENTTNKAEKDVNNITFSFTESLYLSYKKSVLNRFCSRNLISLILFFVIFLIFSFTENFVIPATIVGTIFIFYFIAFVVGLIKTLKRWNDTTKILGYTYRYELQNDALTFLKSKNGELVSKFSVNVSQIKRPWQSKDFFVFEINNTYNALPKELVLANEEFYKIFKHTKEYNSTPYKFVSNVLFTATILSIFGAMFSMAILSLTNNRDVENMWIFYLWTPIPIASIIFGIISGIKQIPNKKNIVAGAIMFALLCLYGSFTFIFASIYDYSNERLLNAEKTVGIDLPDYGFIRTDSIGVSSAGININYDTTVRYSEDEAKAFEKTIKSQSEWITEVPTTLIGVCPQTTYLYADYFIIYNQTTEEINTLPEYSGIYNCIFLAFDTELRTLTIIEYDLQYTK